jgi:hypothetical protein
VITYLLWRGQDMSDWLGETGWTDWLTAIGLDLAAVAWVAYLLGAL